MDKIDGQSKSKSIFTTFYHENEKYFIAIDFGGKKYIIPFKYVIFGSESSTDIDVGVKLPNYLFDVLFPSHYQTILCDELSENLKLLFWDNLNVKKPINPCVMYWKKGRIIRFQKGSKGETNNSIISTFQFHSSIQMYDICPLSIWMKRNIPLKFLGAIRMITGIFTNASFIERNEDLLRSLMNHMLSPMKIPELLLLEKEELVRHLATLLKSYDLKTHILKTVLSSLLDSDDKTQFEKKRKECLSYRKQRNGISSKLLKLIENFKNESENFDYHFDQILVQFWDLHILSKRCVSDMHTIIRKNNTLFDDLFLQSVENDISGCKITLKCFAKAALRSQYVSFQTNVLEHVDMKNITIEGPIDEIQDKLKKIAFQVGQSISLSNMNETYDKESIAKLFPKLSPFLFRKPLTNNNFDDITELIWHMIRIIEDGTVEGLSLSSRELALRDNDEDE